MSFHRMLPHGSDVQCFYAAGQGSGQPLKVLCDGTFVHHLVVNGIRITPPYDAISNLLGARAMLFTTRCIISELRSLGESHLGSLLLANTLMARRCGHKKQKCAVSCIMDIIGAHDRERFFVATMDADLHKKLREIPDVPVVFGLRNGLFLEQPSEFQRTFIKSADGECLHMTEAEFNILDKRAQSKLAIKELRGSSNAEEGEQTLTLDDVKKANGTTKADGVKAEGRKAQFKKKKVKGTNSLSYLEEKSHEQLQSDVMTKEVLHADKTAQSNIKKRKRAMKKKKKKKKKTMTTMTAPEVAQNNIKKRKRGAKKKAAMPVLMQGLSLGA